MVLWPAMCISTAITNKELFIHFFFSFFTTGLTSSESESANARFSLASASTHFSCFSCLFSNCLRVSLSPFSSAATLCSSVRDACFASVSACACCLRSLCKISRSSLNVACNCAARSVSSRSCSIAARKMNNNNAITHNNTKHTHHVCTFSLTYSYHSYTSITMVHPTCSSMRLNNNIIVVMCTMKHAYMQDPQNKQTYSFSHIHALIQSIHAQANHQHMCHQSTFNLICSIKDTTTHLCCPLCHHHQAS